MSELPEIGSRWRHKKTSGVYIIRGYCLIDATEEIGILYRSDSIVGKSWDRNSWDNLLTWLRPLDEFKDMFRLEDAP